MLNSYLVSPICFRKTILVPSGEIAGLIILFISFVICVTFFVMTLNKYRLQTLLFVEANNTKFSLFANDGHLISLPI